MPRYKRKEELPEWVAKKLIRALNRKTKQGFINDLIDLLFHPMFGRSYGIAEIVDFLLHAANEKEFNMSKFIRYNGRSFLESLLFAIRMYKSRKEYEAKWKG